VTRCEHGYLRGECPDDGCLHRREVAAIVARRAVTVPRRRVTVEVESVYATDLLVRWLSRKWREWRAR